MGAAGCNDRVGGMVSAYDDAVINVEHMVGLGGDGDFHLSEAKQWLRSHSALGRRLAGKLGTAHVKRNDAAHPFTSLIRGLDKLQAKIHEKESTTANDDNRSASSEAHLSRMDTGHMAEDKAADSTSYKSIDRNVDSASRRDSANMTPASESEWQTCESNLMIKSYVLKVALPRHVQWTQTESHESRGAQAELLPKMVAMPPTPPVCL